MLGIKLMEIAWGDLGYYYNTVKLVAGSASAPKGAETFNKLRLTLELSWVSQGSIME